MKKLLPLLLLFLASTYCFSQEKIPEKYIVQVTYISGNTEVIPIKNEEIKSNIPKPIVEDGSIFYDGEYLLLNVKSIKILNTIYDKSISKKPKYAVRKVKYWSYKYDRYITLNIIYDPEAERIQREAERNSESIFAPSSNTQIENKPAKFKDTISQPEISSVDRDTIVVSTKQVVYEFDGKGDFKRVENSGIKLVENMINRNQINLEFDRIDIDKNSQEYLELSALIPKKGLYLFEKNMNKEDAIVSCRIVQINITTDE